MQALDYDVSQIIVFLNGDIQRNVFRLIDINQTSNYDFLLLRRYFNGKIVFGGSELNTSNIKSGPKVLQARDWLCEIEYIQIAQGWYHDGPDGTQY